MQGICNIVEKLLILEYKKAGLLELRENIDNTNKNTVEKIIEDFIKKKDNEVKKRSLKTIAIVSSFCLVLGVGYFGFKKKENIEKEKAYIEEVKANLPKSSSKLGCLPGNLAAYHDNGGSPPYIVTSNGFPFFDNVGDLGSYDEMSGSFNILTNMESRYGLQNFNKYNHFIYYITDNNEVRKYNTITNEVSDVYGISARQMIIMDDYMYYIEENGSENMETNWRLLKINLIDRSKEEILNMPIYMFSLNSNYILYTPNYEVSLLYLMNLETKEIIDLSTTNLNIDRKWDTWFALYENCILYVDINDQSLCRVNLNVDGIDIESKEKIQENVDEFILEGQYLYFIEGDYEREGDSKLFVKDLLSNDVYYIDDNVIEINVDGEFMCYYTDENSHIEKFSPERYAKIEQ